MSVCMCVCVCVYMCLSVLAPHRVLKLFYY